MTGGEDGVRPDGPVDLWTVEVDESASAHGPFRLAFEFDGLYLSGMATRAAISVDLDAEVFGNLTEDQRRHLRTAMLTVIGRGPGEDSDGEWWVSDLSRPWSPKGKV